MIISGDKELRWANEDGQWGFDKVDGWKFLTGNPLKLSCWKAIATRPTQTKTVADAVEQGQPHFKATRENLEKIAKDAQGGFVEVEQEGEKWTHVVDDDEGQLTKCRKHLKLCNGSDWVYVCEKGEYFVPSKMGYCGVKPIKPKISESELLHKIKDMGKGVASNGHFGDTVRGWLDKYDIVEVPPND